MITNKTLLKTHIIQQTKHQLRNQTSWQANI